MSTVYKTLNENDVTVIRNQIYEAIPITASLVGSGTYSNNNIENFSHGLFQKVYDYPYLSSSANQIFDLTVGYSNNSALSSSSNYQNKQKIQMYNQMAKLLVGLDHTGSIREFDVDGDLTSGTKIREALFVNFGRLLSKDGIKKGSFQMELGIANRYNEPMSSRIYVKDTAATSSWKTNSPAGEYGILTASNATGSNVTGSIVGLLYYQAGIAVLTASVFSGPAGGHPRGILSSSVEFTSGSITSYAINIDATLTGSTMSGACDGFRQRWFNCQFNNTIELNSTVYLLRIDPREFNYSSNPTYLTGSKIRVKNTSQDLPRAFITTIGLYSDDNELLAVGKLSEPLISNPEIPLTLRARLDY